MTLHKHLPYGLAGLDYVVLHNVPVRHTAHGAVLDLPLGVVEKRVARELITQNVPLRGLEVRFLRKTLGLSLQKFGARLNLSAPAILKWERAAKTRLAPINEVAVRSLAADLLNIAIDGRWSSLLSPLKRAKKLVLRG